VDHWTSPPLPPPPTFFNVQHHRLKSTGDSKQNVEQNSGSRPGHGKKQIGEGVTRKQNRKGRSTEEEGLQRKKQYRGRRSTEEETVQRKKQ
jgi:hypothetical protein